MIVGYIRVSTDKQHPENQKDEICRYAKMHHWTVDRWVVEVVSGKKHVKGRKLGSLLKRLKGDDTLIVTEISRLSRSLTDIMTLIMGKKYQTVLWAQYGNAYGDPRTMSLNEIKLDYKASNREELDAFYAYVPTYEVRQDFSKSIVLTRPFAQFNFATTIGDMDESVSDADMTGLDNTAVVTISNEANTLNLFTGETSFVSDDQESAKGTVVVPATAFLTKVDGNYPTINVEGVDYEVISMNYVLVADADSKNGKTTVDLKLQVGELVIDVPNAYMKRNWRTNVVGELLTAEGSFKVSIDPDFTGSYNEFWSQGTDSETENE